MPKVFTYPIHTRPPHNACVARIVQILSRSSSTGLELRPARDCRSPGRSEAEGEIKMLLRKPHPLGVQCTILTISAGQEPMKCFLTMQDDALSQGKVRDTLEASNGGLREGCGSRVDLLG